MGEAIGAVTARSTGILLGRTTYEMFEPAWSTRTVEDDPGAPFFNDTTKYVVSGTLTDARWRNSTVVGPYDPDTIRRLKNDAEGDLYVSGSGTLVRAMLAARQPFARATTLTAGRQWVAWLSPMSATLGGPSAAGRPNQQTLIGHARSNGSHGASVSSSAASGRGDTIFSSWRLKHGCCASRDAAPRQR